MRRRRFPSPPPPDRIDELLLAGRTRSGQAAPSPAARPVPRPVVAAAGAVPARRSPARRPERVTTDTAQGPVGRSHGRGLARQSGRARHRAAAEPALVTLPGPLRSVRVRPSWGAVAGLLLVGVVVAVVMAVRFVAASASAQPTPLAAVTSAAGATSAGAPSAGGARSAAPGAPTETTTVVVVHVAGHVARPGVVRLPQGSRVQDALAAAGGAGKDGAPDALNLARPVTDGEQIVVPPAGTPPSAAPAGPGSSSSKAGAAPGGKVNLNSADAAALDALPGVGPVTADRILAWRSEHGRFSTVDELGEVPGIGPKLLDQLRPLVTV